MLKKINVQNFENEVLNNAGTVLVDFYADWCGPCKMVAPIVEEIANEREDISVGKVNVDESGALAMRYGIVSIPTLMVFKNGEETARIVGFRPKNDILARL
ncbi:MAG: thioredoxin [Clostridia bacterium]|nr:thioredoxin [Clostridia bacterium]